MSVQYTAACPGCQTTPSPQRSPAGATQTGCEIMNPCPPTCALNEQAFAIECLQFGRLRIPSVGLKRAISAHSVRKAQPDHRAEHVGPQDSDIGTTPSLTTTTITRPAPAIFRGTPTVLNRDLK